MAKHEKSYVDFDQPYEKNLIGMRGILIFTAGLVILIVITFSLMWVLESQLESSAVETKDAKSPMMMENEDRLPPEPRLQVAPGFHVESENGRVNLELKQPRAEYEELRRQWQKTWAEGQKDAKTGTVIALPIDEAKKKFLEENKTSASQQQQSNQEQNIYEDSQTFTSYSSAGRMKTDRRR